MKLDKITLRKAKALRAAGNGRGLPLAWDRVGQRLGVKGYSLRLALDPVVIEQRRQENEIQETMRSLGMRENNLRVPNEVLVERDRVFTSPMTFGQAYFGDPLPGRSALDKRQR